MPFGHFQIRLHCVQKHFQFERKLRESIEFTVNRANIEDPTHIQHKQLSFSLSRDDDDKSFEIK